MYVIENCNFLLMILTVEAYIYIAYEKVSFISNKHCFVNELNSMIRKDIIRFQPTRLVRLVD